MAVPDQLIREIVARGPGAPPGDMLDGRPPAGLLDGRPPVDNTVTTTVQPGGDVLPPGPTSPGIWELRDKGIIPGRAEQIERLKRLKASGLTPEQARQLQAQKFRDTLNQNPNLEGMTPEERMRALGQFQELRGNLQSQTDELQTAERPFAEYVGKTTTPQLGLTGATEAINRGTSGALDELQTSTDRSLEALTGAETTAREDIISAITGGRAPLEDYAREGTAANQRQAALSGALGPEAQRRAYAEYMESPGQQYLREQAEQALVRQSAATGKIGSGELLDELQRNAIGLAAQDFQNAFSRLGDVAGRGLTAGGALGSLGQGQAQLLSNLGTNTAARIADVESGRGTRAADLFSRAGEGLAELRTDAARDISGTFTDTGSALSELLQEQGEGAGDDVLGGAEALTKLITNYGELDAETQRVLGTVLAELGLSEGQSLADLYAATGDARLTGDLSKASQFREGVGDLADFGQDIGDIFGVFT